MDRADDIDISYGRTKHILKIGSMKRSHFSEMTNPEIVEDSFYQLPDEELLMPY